MQGSLRTGSVFRAIANYLTEKKVRCFQFENVIPLAAKPTQQVSGCEGSKKKEPTVMGPSNLSAVVAVLRNEAGMFTHCWHLDSREQFGSGQQRQRLWGLSFRLEDLCMTEECAHSVLDEIMNSLAGVQPCHPADYLLPESSAAVRLQRLQHTFKNLSVQDFLRTDHAHAQAEEHEGARSERGLRIDTLFQTEGILPGAFPSKRRKNRSTE